MRSTLWWAALPALALASATCGDDAVDPQTLLGTWDATAMQFTSVANPQDQVDAIDVGGAFVITLAANNMCQATLTLPGEPPENLTGTWSASADVFTLQWTGEMFETQFDFVSSGNTLFLTGGHVNFDFGGGDEEATLDVTLVRR
jgi:hypothetical protein